MTLQNFYYAAAGTCVLIATAINIVLFLRTRPDRLKTAIRDAMSPVIERLDDVESEQARQGEQQRVQGLSLAKLSSDLSHAPNREDLNAIHHRITDVVRSGSRIEALQQTTAEQLARVNQFLLEHGRD